jgi:hypothetical protein
MKTHMTLMAVGLLGLIAGCSTVDSRIAKEREQFDAWPAEVQEKIRTGRVDVGFTPGQVRVALGEPAKKYRRTTAEGEAEVWTYAGGRWGMSVGVGVGSVRSGGAYGGGVAYEPPTYGADDERLRIVFEADRVVSIEKKTK